MDFVRHSGVLPPPMIAARSPSDAPVTASTLRSLRNPEIAPSTIARTMVIWISARMIAIG